ncbi:MAG: hypothetical protein FJ399_03560 [Verrucomicrobia bacterium]|nr:hypothetical protein [Verrucomicrobiota bacterium]
MKPWFFAHLLVCVLLASVLGTEPLVPNMHSLSVLNDKVYVTPIRDSINADDLRPQVLSAAMLRRLKESKCILVDATNGGKTERLYEHKLTEQKVSSVVERLLADLGFKPGIGFPVCIVVRAGAIEMNTPQHFLKDGSELRPGDVIVFARFTVASRKGSN